MSTQPKYSWVSAAATHVGHIRQVNEDAHLVRDDLSLWAVADGMGGHHAGDVASSKIVEILDQTSSDSPTSPLSAYVDLVEDKIISANQELINLAKEHKDNRTIGSTIVTMIVADDHCALLWAGDSRAYRCRDGQTVQLTRDHSQVEEMVRQGLILPEEAEQHPASNVITRAVGASEKIFVDVGIEEIISGDTFLLCSDGLNKHVSDEEINEFLQIQNIDDIPDKLVETTLNRGAVDNVTVIVIRAIESSNENESTNASNTD